MLFSRIQYKKVESAVQSDGEDNSDRCIYTLCGARLVERKPKGDADDRRGKHMEERRADEAEVSRHDSLDGRIAGKRGKKKKGVLDGCKAERDRNHIDNGVDRLVILTAPQDGDARGKIF